MKLIDLIRTDEYSDEAMSLFYMLAVDQEIEYVDIINVDIDVDDKLFSIEITDKFKKKYGIKGNFIFRRTSLKI